MSDKEEVKIHVLYKPNGSKIHVNDNSLKYAKSIGCTDKKPKETK